MHRFYSDLKALLMAVSLFIVTPLSALDRGEEPDSLEAAKVLGSRERMARMEGDVESVQFGKKVADIVLEIGYAPEIR